MPPPRQSLITARLLLRPFEVADAERVVAIQSNWNVARMLRAMTWPVTLAETRAWLASHAAEWAAGSAYRFAVVLDGQVIGCADIDEIARGRADLGYWLDDAHWGHGYATEAAEAVIAFAFAVGLAGLDSGHASDNPASGAVLRKLGFRHVGDEERWSNPRGGAIVRRVYRLERGAR